MSFRPLAPAALARALALGLAATAAVATAAAPVAAQTFPTDDPVLRRIWSVGMDSSHTERLAHALLDSVGPRLTGSPLQDAANAWAIRTYKQWGVEARAEKVGTWRGWRRGWSHIDLVSPRVRTLEGTMLGYSPGTGRTPLVASTVVLPRFADSTEFVKWLPESRGKLVLVSPPLPSCRESGDWAENATPASKARYDSARAALLREWGGRNVRGTGHSLALGTGELGLRLERAGAAGIVTSRAKDALGTYDVFETYNRRAPAVALSCEDYGLVFRLTESGAAPTLRLDLDAELLGERPIFNTVATIRGSEKPDEYILLSAHFDSWDGASGATDNGTGTVTMMEAVRILTHVYPRPKRTIVVGHWTAEEVGLVGSQAFAEDHPEIVAGLHVLFNQDNGTGRIVRVGGGGLPDAAAHITRWLGKLPTELRAQINFSGPGFPSAGGSDDAAFACRGAPAIGLGALSWSYGNVTWHSNRDTYDKIVFDDLKSNATLTAMLTYLASEDPTKITRERVDLAAAAASAPNAAGPRRRGPTTWPVCGEAPRTTDPRLR